MAILEYHARPARTRAAVSTTTLETYHGAFTATVLFRQLNVPIVGGLGLAAISVLAEVVAMTAHILTLHGVFFQMVSVQCDITKNS